MRNDFGRNSQHTQTKKVVGSVRQTQLVTSFGCGSIIDFVQDTVMIAGTDLWSWAENDAKNEFIIYNENLQRLLGKDYFVRPKTEAKKPQAQFAKSEDIPAYRFPEMFYCTQCHRLIKASAIDHQRGKRIKCICGSDKIVPPRFVVACEHGHIEDFPYDKWVHLGKPCTKSNAPKLKMFNVGNKTSIDSLFIHCEDCGAKRSMQSAFSKNALCNIKQCGANSPWLERNLGTECLSTLNTLLRTATNVYFPATASALKIPPWSDKVTDLLVRYYDMIILREDLLDGIIETAIAPKCPELTKEEIKIAFERIKAIRQHGGAKKTSFDNYRDEYIALKRELPPDHEFSAEEVPVPRAFATLIKRVIAVDRLTETVAILGFTRVLPWSGNPEDEHLAPLSTTPKPWLPAIQMNGEGIFLEFDMTALEGWRKDVGDYYQPMLNRLNQSFLSNDRASAEYVLLHTFSHLLIRQLSVECGYGAASIKEKIYCTFNEHPEFPMAGVLIYTASPDSDGSLGGLVEQASPERLGPLIHNMLADANWCSSDPLCAYTSGENGQGLDSLNYAACHNCALLPETSCEFRNVLLDRAALIGTLERPELAFFGEVAE